MVRSNDNLKRYASYAIGTILETLDTVSRDEEMSEAGKHAMKRKVFKAVRQMEENIRKGLSDGSLLNAIDNHEGDRPVPKRQPCQAGVSAVRPHDDFRGGSGGQKVHA